MASNPREMPQPGEPQCAADGVRNGPDGPGGTEFYRSCTAPGSVDVGGELLCEGHADERGYEEPVRFWSSGPSLVELDAYGDFAPDEYRQSHPHRCRRGRAEPSPSSYTEAGPPAHV